MAGPASLASSRHAGVRRARPLRVRPARAGGGARAAGHVIRLDLNGAAVLYTAREGGVSEGAYAELNLGPWTDDDPEAVSANHDLLAVAAELPRHDFAWARQVHGIDVLALREPRTTRSTRRRQTARPRDCRALRRRSS